VVGLGRDQHLGGHSLSVLVVASLAVAPELARNPAVVLHGCEVRHVEYVVEAFVEAVEMEHLSHCLGRSLDCVVMRGCLR
jgi:hypothetical protein